MTSLVLLLFIFMTLTVKSSFSTKMAAYLQYCPQVYALLERLKVSLDNWLSTVHFCCVI